MRMADGLDISLNKIAVCVLATDGRLIWQGKVSCEPDPLIDKLATWRDAIDSVGLEACPMSEWLHRHLVAAGFTAICVDTRHAQRFLSTRPVKTDRNDARGLAEMMRVGHDRPVHVKAAEAQHVRTVLQARRQIVASLLGLQNTMRGLLRAYGLKVGEVHRNRFGDRIRELLREQPLLEVAIGPLLRATELLVAERSKLDTRLTQAANGDAVYKRLMTIPGVGPITSLAFRATVDDPARFQISKLVGAHFGLTPKVYQSGETDRSGSISKAGDHLMRHLLYEAASSLMTRCPKHSRLRAWGVAIARRRGAKKARVAVARKLAVIMHRMWVSGTAFVFGGEASVPVAA